jgi:hypothetical protein
MTFHILGMSSSQMTNSYFSEELKPPSSIGLYRKKRKDLNGNMLLQIGIVHCQVRLPVNGDADTVSWLATKYMINDH